VNFAPDKIPLGDKSLSNVYSVPTLCDGAQMAIFCVMLASCIFGEPHAAHFRHAFYKFAIRPHHVWKYNNNNNNPICKAPECQKTSVALYLLPCGRPLRIGEEKRRKKKKILTTAAK